MQKHCEFHKEPQEINLIEKECVNCYALHILNSSNLCLLCDPIKGIKIKLGKQTKVQDYLDRHKYQYISCDKIINNGVCIKNRPDFLFDCISHYVVLEIDEYQHRDISVNCEIERMKNIAGALGTPTIFIRYNPDTYKIKNKKNDKHFAIRMRDLESRLKYYMNININELAKIGFLSVLYMYYENYDKGTQQLETLMEYEIN